ncbi:MAG: hypothetical protein A3J49_04330 [Gallionellales bacterium RIFCSPHIGHO2_02_FULL_57_16]|nr:MAG: hypothetical protein A3J49_04330 [Gallionellales bacterium RIFCSPHIGHO2_02_FULL_57_16]
MGFPLSATQQVTANQRKPIQTSHFSAFLIFPIDQILVQKGLFLPLFGQDFVTISIGPATYGRFFCLSWCKEATRKPNNPLSCKS